MSGRWRYPAAATGLASLFLFYYWTQALTYKPDQLFTVKTALNRATYEGLVLATLALSAVFWMWMHAIDRVQNTAVRRVLKWLFLIMLLVPLNSFRDTLKVTHPLLGGELLRQLSPPVVWGLVISIAGAAAVISAIWTRQAYRAAILVLSFCWPVALLCLSQAAWALMHPSPVYADKAPAERISGDGPGGPRVVLIVFDEWDYRLTFEARPKGLRLPEFDRLRDKSLFATQAFTPSTSTLHSISALLAGRDIEAIRQLGPADAEVRFKGNPGWVRWEHAVTMFREARSIGADSGMLGWYLPYCRVMGDQMADCWWAGLPRRIASLGQSSLEAAFNLMRVSFESSLLSPFGPSLTTQRTAALIQEMEERALRLAGDPGIRLVVLHLIPPHGPHSYNRENGRFELANAPLRGYYDSLALADKTLGRIRSRLQESGVAERTHLLVTSDHSYRTARGLGQPRDHRVPWMLHLANGNESKVIDRQFSWVRTYDLVLGLLAGKVRALDEAAHVMGMQ